MDTINIEEASSEIDEYIRLYTSHLAYLRKTIELSEKAMEIFDSGIPNNDNSHFLEIKAMHSFNALLTIALLDLYVISKRLLVSHTNWEKLFFIKQGYLIIYETIKTYGKYSQQINNLVKLKYRTLQVTYADISTNLKKFIKEYGSDIKRVRHIIAGHIEGNFASYYDTAMSIKGETELKAITSFISIVNAMWNLSFEIEQISSQEAMKELEREGMGKSIEEYHININLKLNKLKLQIEEKIEILKSEIKQ